MKHEGITKFNRYAILFSLCLFTIVLSKTASAQEFNPLAIFGQKKKAYIEPEGYYRAVFPAGFRCNASKKRVVVCNGTRRHRNAYFEVRVTDVPKSANSAVVALREMKKYRKREHFQLIAKRKMSMNGLPGISFTYSYDSLGNIQYPMGVQTFFWVKNGKLITIYFETRLANFKTYANDLNVFFGNFYPASIGADGKPNWRDLEMDQQKRSDEKRKTFGG